MKQYNLQFTIHSISSIGDTSVSSPVPISSFNPTICVVFLINGDALRSATSSLTLSSILLRSYQRPKTQTGTLYLPFDLAKLHALNGSLFFRSKLNQSSFDLMVIKMRQSTVGMVYNDNRSRCSDGLENCNGANCVKCSSPCIANDRRFCFLLIRFLTDIYLRNRLPTEVMI